MSLASRFYPPSQGSPVDPRYPSDYADNYSWEHRGWNQQGYRFCKSNKADLGVSLIIEGALVLLNDCSVTGRPRFDQSAQLASSGLIFLLRPE